MGFVSVPLALDPNRPIGNLSAWNDCISPPTKIWSSLTGLRHPSWSERRSTFSSSRDKLTVFDWMQSASASAVTSQLGDSNIMADVAGTPSLISRYKLRTRTPSGNGPTAELCGSIQTGLSTSIASCQRLRMKSPIRTKPSPSLDRSSHASSGMT